MNQFDLLLHSVLGRMLALCLCCGMTAASCNPGGGPLAPVSGVRDFQQVAFVSVPHGRLNTAGGNLVVARVDLSIDTRLGTREIGATYNSQSGIWSWSFDLFYDGSVFVDGTEARYEIGQHPSGEALAGSHWVKVDATSMKTKGGLVHVFDPASGRLDHVRWASSEYPRLRFQRSLVGGEQRISSVEQCKTASSNCSLVYDVTYDGQGRVSALADRAGRATEYAYDAVGLLATARDALDLEQGWAGQRYEYQGTLLSAITNSEGERVEYSYRGRRLDTAQRVGAEAPTQRFVYTASQAGIHTTRVIDPNGFVTSYRYDKSRRVVERRLDALGESTRWVWSGLRPIQQTDPAGTIRSWTWQGDDPVSKTAPSGNLRSLQYVPTAVNRDNPLQRPIASITDAIGLVEQRQYDGAGRLTSRSNGEAESTSWSYKANEMIDTVTRADGVAVSFSSYGEAGHPENFETGGIESIRSFDAVGNRISGPGLGGEVPGVVSRRFDGDRNVTEVVMGDHSLFGSTTVEPITIEYRSDGQRSAIRRPFGADHEFTYDAVGRAVASRERVDGVWRTTTVEFDPAGRPVAQQRPNGMRVEWQRDAAGRAVALRGFRGAVLESEALMTYAAGRLVSIEDSLRTGDGLVVYDSAGRISAIGHPEGEATSFQYDLRGRTTRELFYDEQLQLVADLGSGYDAADRRTSISDGPDLLLATSHVDGHPDTITYGNGLVRSFAYDALGEVAGMEMRDDGGTLVESTSLDLSVAFNSRILTARSESFGALPQLTEEVYQLSPSDPTLDPNGMVGRRVSGWAPAASASLRPMSYDVLGNLTAVDAAPLFYNAERNRLQSVDSAQFGNIAYTYDEAGFVMSRKGETLGWTALGKLASHGADTFEWDSLGRSVQSTQAGVTTRSRWGGRILAAANGTPLTLDGGDFQLDLVGGSHLFRHFDFRGNVKLVSGEAGDIVSHYRYGPHGVDTVFGDASDEVRFVGRSQIGDLMILGARIYDPAAGIFLSPDPILNVVNQYAYTLGNPVEFEDRDGLTGLSEFIAGIIGGLGAGLVANATTTAVQAAVAGGVVLTPAVVIVSGVGVVFILVAFGVYYWDSNNAPHPTPDPDAPGSGGGSRSLASPGGGVPAGGCSAPAALLHMPGLPGSRSAWMWFLLPTQLLLGVGLLRRRLAAKPG